MTWGVASAKAKFSAVLDLAEAEGPQQVQRRRQRYLVVTEEQWEERRRPAPVAAETKPEPGQSLWDLLRCAPEEGDPELILPERTGGFRAVEF